MRALQVPPEGAIGPNEHGAVAIRCAAKLNVCLSVQAPDPAADGRHPLVSAMTPLNFGDDLLARRRPDGGIALTRSWAPDAPVPTPLAWPVEEDLAWQAAAAFGRAAGVSVDVDLELRKRIPCGGGLGGGSTNAAGVLVAMNRLWPGAVCPAALLELATGLGSDVSFALSAARGGGACVVSGFGEVVEPLPVAEPGGFHAALLFPGASCPTALVFAALDDRLRAGEVPGAWTRADVRAAAARGWTQLIALGNNLTGPAADVQPRLNEVLCMLARAKLQAHVTGSGSTLFLHAPTAHAAESLAARIARSTGLPSIAVSAPPPADRGGQTPPGAEAVLNPPAAAVAAGS